MYTIIETPTFKNDVEKIWLEQERGDFFSWLAANRVLVMSYPIVMAVAKSGGLSAIQASEVV